MNLRKDHHRIINVNLLSNVRMSFIHSPSNDSVNVLYQKEGGRLAVLKWVDGYIDLEVEIALHFAIARPFEFFYSNTTCHV